MLDVLSDMLVKIRQGEIRGAPSRSVGGKAYYSFKGIPYAKPPVGDLRFKPPAPIEPWEGIKDATKEGNIALQWDEKRKCVVGNEDCLFLNVHTPKLQSGDEPLPVVVYIHHGGFVQGSGNSDIFGPDFFIENNIVFVSMNYRLGAFGFLCLYTKEAPGNVGLRDQNLALKWVHENIATFGGRPDRITLMGFSAGSASVEYHTLSPMSSGLFDKAVCVSGSALNPWARSTDPVGSAFKVGRSLKFDETEKEALLKFFMNAKAELLVPDTSKCNEEMLTSGELFSFKPVVERRLKDVTPFLCQDPIELLKSGKFSKVLTLMGFSEKEGTVFKELYGKDIIDEIRAGKYSNYMPKWLKTKSEHALNDLLRKQYQNRHTDQNENDSVNDFLTDLLFVGGINSSLILRHKYNNEIYLYMFMYDSKVNYLKYIYDVKEKGACHIDEISYLSYSCEVNNEGFNSTDKMVRERMVEMWTNFIRFGKPIQSHSKLGVKWTHISNRIHYLEIGSELVAKSDPWSERLALWREIYSAF